MLLFWKMIDTTQMSKPPECAATFLKKFRSFYVCHLGIQSVTYRVDTPCSTLHDSLFSRDIFEWMYDLNLKPKYLLKSRKQNIF